jgi:hypothetical protein
MGGGSVAGFLETAEDLSGVNRKGAGFSTKMRGTGIKDQGLSENRSTLFISCVLEPFQLYGEFQ